MKKLSIISLSILLALSLSVTAWAAGQAKGKDLNSTTAIPVTGTYQKSSIDGTVYSVDITWGNMDFTYQTTGKHWDPATHEYVTTSEGWRCTEGANQVTITNHSNAEVKCTLEYQSNDNYTDITGTFDPSSAEVLLSSAENKAIGAIALTQSFTLQLNGSLQENTNAQTIGTITVTIAETPT